MRIASDGGPEPIDHLEPAGADPDAGHDPPPAAASPQPQDGVDLADGSPHDAIFEPASPQQRPARGYTREQADKDAKALYDATEGGLTGWGTDEDAIWRTLDGKSKADIDQIRQSYRDHYGKDMDAVLRGEVGGDDRAHLDALLKGEENSAETDAVRIQAEMDGVFGDEEEVLKTLEKASPAERRAIAEAYARKHGAPAGVEPERFLQSRIDGDASFSAEEKQRARDLLSVGSARTPDEARRLEADAAAGRIRAAVDGAGTDEGSIRELLAGKSKQQIDDIARSYRDRYGEDLRARLADETSGAERDELLALYDSGKGGAGGAAARDAARLKQAVDGMGTDEGAIRELLAGKSKQQIDDIAAAYRQRYGHGLRDRLVEETDGAERDELLSLLDHGKDGGAGVAVARDAARLKQALDGAGTDEGAIREILHSKSKGEIDDLARVYRDRYGEDLRARLDDELDGRDQVELLDQLFDRGKIDERDPGAGAERLRRLRERQETEQSFGSWLTGGIQDVVKGESDEARLDRNAAAAEQALAGGDDARAGQLLGYAEGDLDSFQQAKDSAAEAAATGAAVVVSTAVVVASAGTATPLVIAADAALLGGAASATTYAVMQGDAADPADVARQGAIGAATGATAVVGLPASAAGKTAVAAGLEGAASGVAREAAVGAGEQVAAGGVRRAVLEGAGQGAKAGAAGGAADGAVRAATESETWEDGLADGLLKVGERAAVGAAAGAVTGGVTGAAVGGGAQALESSIAARREAWEIAEAVKGRIAREPDNFNLDYSPRDIRHINARGKELGLTGQEIEDMILAGSRTKKPISAGELVQQMENYANEVMPRGYPYRFDSAEHFAQFKAELGDGLRRAGVPTDDVRVQGSALRKPGAGDVDIAVMVDDRQFDELLVKAFSPPNGSPIRPVVNGKGGEAIDMSTLGREELLELVKRFKADEARPAAEREFNSRAQTFLHAFEARKMREQEAGTRDLERLLTAKYGKVDVSVMSRGGGFDMRPYMRVD